MEKMFETATRSKYLFQYKGQISVIDLWDLSVKELDTIYKDLNAQLKLTKEESLLDVKTSEDTVLQNKIEIIKYVVSVKQAEKLIRLQEEEAKELKQKALSILASRQDDKFKNLSDEELEKIAGKI